MKRRLTLALSVLCAASGSAIAAPENLALGKSYTMAPPPNYPLCTDSGDAQQLTDGVVSSGADYLWKRKSTVGWYDSRAVTITIDLGATQSIDKVTFRTAAGAANVEWPEAIYVFVGDHPEQQRYVADMVEQQARRMSAAYSVFRFVAERLNARGRYVTFVSVVANRRYLFTDEVEVFGPVGGAAVPGNSSTVSGTLGPPAEFVRRLWRERGASRRVRTDIAALRAIIAASITGSARSKLEKELAAAEADAGSVRDASAQMRMTLPLSGVHERLFAVRAHAMRAAGIAPVLLWDAGHWAPPSLLEIPTAARSPQLSTAVMRGNDYRSLSFAITNASSSRIDVRVNIADLGLSAPEVKLLQSTWTDTLDGHPVAAALEPLPGGVSTSGVLQIASGLTREIWLTVRAGAVPAETYRGAVVVSAPGFHQRIPITITVSSMQLPDETSLSVGGFDYLDQETFYDLKPTNRQALIRFLDDHRIDAAWATNDVLPLADDAEHADARALDRWLERRPAARHRYVYLAVNRLKEPDPGRSEFATQARRWTDTWAKLIRARGLKPESFSLLLVDEPSSAAADRLAVAWARAIHSASVGFEVWENPAGGGFAPRSDLIAASDVVCEQVESLTMESASDAQILTKWAAQPRHSLELYSTGGQAPARDAYRDYRLLPWLAWKKGARAVHYWSLIDAGGASSWRPYEATRDQFSPLFIDASSVTTTRQFEALREGVEDHAYLSMLRQAVNRSAPSNPARIRATALLESVDTVLNGNPTIGSDSAETVRLEILELLPRLLRDR